MRQARPNFLNIVLLPKLIRIGNQFNVVDLGDVAYFFTSDKTTLLTTKTGKKYPIDQSLDKLEEELQAAEFFRLNRQVIARLEAISRMTAYSRSRVKIELNPPLDELLIVSTERTTQLKKWIKGEL